MVWITLVDKKKQFKNLRKLESNKQPVIGERTIDSLLFLSGSLGSFLKYDING
jgi:hypothetical protein